MADKIGRYDVIRKIGAGSTATVYLGRAGSEEVALKVLHKHLVMDAVILERFRREAALARELEHEAIVRVHDFISREEQAVLVMEYCAGGNLADWFSADADEVIAVAARAAGALAFAHNRGIIHRDLKPENMLKDAAGRIKICDFGSAHIQNLLGLTTSTLFTGTPQFVAPELLAGNTADPRSDLYSLGALLYRAVTGRPHRDNSVIALLKKQAPVPSPAALIPHFPAWLSALIMNLLDDIEKRIPDAETLLHLLACKTAPGERKVKACLYCRKPMAEEAALCLECGKAELRLESYTGADAQFLALTKITEKAETLHHFLSILKALAGQPDLDFKFIIGDPRLYSKEEGKTGIKLPVRVLDNLTTDMCRELILLLKGPYTGQITLEPRPMQQVRKIKRGPLIAAGKGVIRLEAAENFLEGALQKNRQLTGTDSRLLFNKITEAGYAVLRKYAALAYADTIRQLLTRLLDTASAACLELNRIGEYLNSVSLSNLYNEWIRIDHLLKKSGQPGEIQALIERKRQQQLLYEKYQVQEQKYARLKNTLLEIYGKLGIPGSPAETNPPSAAGAESTIAVLRQFFDNTENK